MNGSRVKMESVYVNEFFYDFTQRSKVSHLVEWMLKEQDLGRVR